MVKKVLKFGGTSVGSIDRVQHVAKIIEKEHKNMEIYMAIQIVQKYFVVNLRAFKGIPTDLRYV